MRRCLSSTRARGRSTLNCNFPLPHVFPPPPFPLEREPTASAPRGDTLGSRIDRDISLIMPPSLVRRLRSNMAQSDGTTVKLGARYGRRLATPIPFSNRHMSCISTLRTRKNDAEGVVFLLGKICLSLKKLSYIRHVVACVFNGGFESGIGNVFCERYDCVFVFERHLDKRYSVHF